MSNYNSKVLVRRAHGIGFGVVLGVGRRQNGPCEYSPGMFLELLLYRARIYIGQVWGDKRLEVRW